MVKVVRATQEELKAAVTALREGDVIAFPTETVYGLGANAQDARAVRRVFELKGRPADHPLIVQGPGAGPEVTAGGVFADLLRLSAYLGARL